MANKYLSIDEWEFNKQHVQPANMKLDDGITSGNFISSESIVLAAGPASVGGPTFDPTELIPIGVTDGIQIAQNKNMLQLWEVGSRFPYFMPGRNFIQGSMGRVVFNGDSLLAALTRRNAVDGNDPQFEDNPPGGPLVDPTHQEGNFYLNLASDYFNHSFGLAAFFRDSEGDWVAGFYLENCFIQNHAMSLSAQQTVVMENVTIRISNIWPLSIEGLIS